MDSIIFENIYRRIADRQARAYDKAIYKALGFIPSKQEVKDHCHIELDVSSGTETVCWKGEPVIRFWPASYEVKVDGETTTLVFQQDFKILKDKN